MIQDTKQSPAYTYGNVQLTFCHVGGRSYLAKCLSYYYTTLVMKQSLLQ